MATIEFTRASGGVYEAPGVGWIKQKSLMSYDFIGGAAGIPEELTFKRNWTGRHHTIEDATGRVRGEHERQGWAGTKGPLMWDDVQYEFANHSAWKGSFVVRRHNEDLATFTPKRFGRTIEVESIDHAHIPAGLVLFGIWMTILRQRDAAAASG